MTFESLARLEPQLKNIERHCKSICHLNWRERQAAWRETRQEYFLLVGWGRKSGPKILQGSQAWDICHVYFYDLAHADSDEPTEEE